MSDWTIGIRFQATDETGPAVASAKKGLDSVTGASDAAATSTSKLEKVSGLAGAAMRTLTGAGVTALVGALSDAANAGAQEEASLIRVQTAVVNSGATWQAQADSIQSVIKAGRELGFHNDELNDSFALLVEQTGSAEAAMQRIQMAENLARGAHIDLYTASKLLGKVTDENVNVLGRYGINVQKGATETELFGVIQKKFGGQAEAYGASTAGAIDRTKVAIEGWRAAIGNSLGPAQMYIALLPGLSTGMTAAGGAVGLITGHLGGFLNAINPVRIATGLWTAAQAALNLVMSANPIAIAVLAIAGLAVAVKLAYDHFEGFRSVVDAALGVLRNLLAPLGFVVDAVRALGTAVGLIPASTNEMKTEASADFDHLEKNATASTSLMGSNIKAEAQKIADFVPAAFKLMKEAAVENAQDMRIDTVLAAMGMAANVRDAVADMVSGVTGKTAEERDAIVYDMQVARLQAALRARGLSEDVVKEIDRMVYDSKLSMAEFARITAEKMETAHDAAEARAEGMHDVGVNFALGFIHGIEEQQSAAREAAQKLAQAAVGGSSDVLKEASPSKVAMQQGEEYASGLAIGIASGVGPVGMAAASLVSSMIANIQQQIARLGQLSMTPVGLGGTATPAVVTAGLTAHNANLAAGLIQPGRTPVGFTPAGVPYYEEGTPYVPRTGLAVVHRGERIVSARENAAAELGGGGDVVVHTHISLDSRVLAEAVSRHQGARAVVRGYAKRR